MGLKHPFLLPLTCSILGGLSLFLGIAIIAMQESGNTPISPWCVLFLVAGTTLFCCSIVLFVRRNREAFRALSHLRSAAHAVVQGDRAAFEHSSTAVDALEQYAARQKELAELLMAMGSGQTRSLEGLTGREDPLSIAVVSVAESLQASSFTTENRAELDRSLAELSNAVVNAGNGDLGRFCSAEHEPTAGLAVDINRMMAGLSLHIGQLKEASARIGITVAETENAITGLVRNAGEHIGHSETTAGSLAGLVRRSIGISESAAKIHSPFPHFERQARSITETMAESISASRSIRMQVQESLKRTKRLGERSQELTRLVFDLEELSDRVNILALNSSLRSNGGAGADAAFATGEMEQMSERTSKLTRQLRQMAQAVSAETREASSSMESMIRDVILSTSLAEKMVNSSRELAESLWETGQQIGSLSDNIDSHAKAIGELSRSMATFRETSEAVRTGSRTSIDAVHSASQAVSDMQAALAVFILQPNALPAEPKELGSNRFVN